MANKKGFWLGAVIGGIIGVMFAPKSGEQTREDIKRVAEEVKDDLASKAKDTEVTGSRWINKAKGAAKATKEALTADTELGSEIKQAEAKRKAKSLKKDIKKTVKKKA